MNVETAPLAKSGDTLYATEEIIHAIIVAIIPPVMNPSALLTRPRSPFLTNLLSTASMIFVNIIETKNSNT